MDFKDLRDLHRAFDLHPVVMVWIFCPVKTLIVVRHATAGWDDPALDDFDRPLTSRGRQEAESVGSAISRLQLPVGKILASKALRAETTARLLKRIIGWQPETLGLTEHLYLADAVIIQELCWEVPDEIETLIVVGHNPGVSDFCRMISDFAEDDLKPAGVVRFQGDFPSWTDLQENSCRVVY